MNNELYEKVDQYISNLLGIEDEALKATEQSISESDIPQISVSPVQGKFLEILARLCKATKILELGTLAGYSTICLARALPKNGRLISLELDPKHATVAQKNINRAQLEDVVELRIGKALELLPQLEQEGVGPFDMIFIDADKPPYTEYFQWALRLSRPGTLIVADNVIREGKVLDENSSDEMVKGVHRFNQKLSETESVIATIVQMVGAKEHDGMAIMIVK